MVVEDDATVDVGDLVRRACAIGIDDDGVEATGQRHTRAIRRVRIEAVL